MTVADELQHIKLLVNEKTQSFAKELSLDTSTILIN